MRLYLTKNTCSISKKEWAVQILTSCFECIHVFHYLLVFWLLKTSFHVMALIPPQPIYKYLKLMHVFDTRWCSVLTLFLIFMCLSLCVFYDNSFILHRWTIKSFSIWQYYKVHIYSGSNSGIFCTQLTY